MGKLGVFGILFVMSLFLMVSIPALEDQTIGTFIEGKDVVLIQTCDNCTFVNVSSVLWPNSTIALTGPVSMTKNNNFYNYSFNKTDPLGIYTYITCGDNNGIVSCQDLTFKINQIGQDASISEAIIYFVLLIGVFLVFLLGLYFTITLPWVNMRGEDNKVISVSKLKYIKMGLMPLTYALFNWFLNILLGMSRFLDVELYFVFFAMMFRIITSMAWVLGFVWAIVFLVVLKNDSRIIKTLKFKP